MCVEGGSDLEGSTMEPDIPAELDLSDEISGLVEDRGESLWDTGEGCGPAGGSDRSVPPDRAVRIGQATCNRSSD